MTHRQSLLIGTFLLLLFGIAHLEWAIAQHTPVRAARVDAISLRSPDDEGPSSRSA